MVDRIGRQSARWHNGRASIKLRIWRVAPRADIRRVGLGRRACALCAIFLLRGRIRIGRGWAGWTVRRFNRLERAGHWLLALSCIVLALTGLNAAYGRHVLLPLLGADSFADIGWWARWLHEKVAFAFMAALAVTFLLWVRHSLPGWRDLVWLAKGGGLLAGVHPPAWKFNTGQKLLFWLVMVGGLALSLSGLALLFPHEAVTVAQTHAVANALVVYLGLTPALPTEPSLQQAVHDAALWHRTAALALLAAIIVHVYLRTLGIEGAFCAMASGEVDANWARQHHSLWAEREIGESEERAQAKPAPAPVAPAP